MLTTFGVVLLAADDVEEPGALWTEGQQRHLKNRGHDGQTEQHRPQVLAAQQGLQPEDLHNTHRVKRGDGAEGWEPPCTTRFTLPYLRYEDTGDYSQLVQGP